MLLLLYVELNYFLHPTYKFRFTPDSEFTAKLKLNVDLTVAMPCDGIGADVLDSTNQNTFSYGRLREDPAWFELDTFQRKHFESVKMFKTGFF